MPWQIIGKEQADSSWKIISKDPEFPYAELQPAASEEPSILRRGMEHFGLAKPEELTAAERARADVELAAKKEGVPLEEYREGPQLLEQAAQGALDVGTFGILPRVHRIMTAEEPGFEPHGTAQEITKGVGQLAGFLGGGPGGVTRLVSKAGRGVLGAKNVEALNQYWLGRIPVQTALQAAGLGAGFGTMSIGEALDKSTLSDALDTVWRNTKEGAKVGAIFGAGGAAFPKQRIMRIASIMTALEAERYAQAPEAGLPVMDERAISQKLFDYGMDLYFSWHGMGDKILDTVETKTTKLLSEGRGRITDPRRLLKEAQEEIRRKALPEAPREVTARYGPETERGFQILGVEPETVGEVPPTVRAAPDLVPEFERQPAPEPSILRKGPEPAPITEAQRRARIFQGKEVYPAEEGPPVYPVPERPRPEVFFRRGEQIVPELPSRPDWTRQVPIMEQISQKALPPAPPVTPEPTRPDWVRSIPVQEQISQRALPGEVQPPPTIPEPVSGRLAELAGAAIRGKAQKTEPTLTELAQKAVTPPVPPHRFTAEQIRMYREGQKVAIKHKKNKTVTKLHSVIGAVSGLEEDEEGNIRFDPTKAMLGMLGAGIGERLTRGRGKGKFLRAQGRLRGRETVRSVAPRLGKAKVLKSWNEAALEKGAWILPEWDGAGSMGEIFEYAKNMEYIDPIVTNKRQSLRWQKNPITGAYGNVGKMAYPSRAYPEGRNTYDFQGCGREAWAIHNGILGEGPYGRGSAACYGGACYAETLLQLYGGKEASIAGARRSLNVPKEVREEVQKMVRDRGLEAALERWPEYVIKQYPDTGKITVKTIQEQGSAMVSTNLQPADGIDVRLGVDTDGSAWLSSPEVMDALLKANPRTLTIYSSAYFKPPKPHPLSGRTIINTTVSGWHPLAETIHRLEYAREARDSGWNVILREVVANPKQFANEEVSLYNRIHDMIMDTDFFVMQQPLHKGSTMSEPLFEMPACCWAKKGAPHTCDMCEVAEGLGRGFRHYWGIKEEPQKGELYFQKTKLEPKFKVPTTELKGGYKLQREYGLAEEAAPSYTEETKTLRIPATVESEKAKAIVNEVLAGRKPSYDLFEGSLVGDMADEAGIKYFASGPSLELLLPKELRTKVKEIAGNLAMKRDDVISHYLRWIAGKTDPDIKVILERSHGPQVGQLLRNMEGILSQTKEGRTIYEAMRIFKEQTPKQMLRWQQQYREAVKGLTDVQKQKAIDLLDTTETITGGRPEELAGAQLRSLLQGIRQYLVDNGHTVGYIEGYLPHIFQGRFWVKEEGGFARKVETFGEALKIADELSKKTGKQVTVMQDTFIPSDDATMLSQKAYWRLIKNLREQVGDAVEVIGVTSEDARSMLQGVARPKPRPRFFGNMRSRLVNNPNFLRDLDSIMDLYFYGASRKVHQDRAWKIVQKNLETMPESDADLRRFIENTYMPQALAHPTQLEEGIARSLNAFPLFPWKGQTGQDVRRMMHTANLPQYAMDLGVSLSSAMANATQFWINAYPIVGERASLVGYKKGWQTFGNKKLFDEVDRMGITQAVSSLTGEILMPKDIVKKVRDNFAEVKNTADGLRVIMETSLVPFSTVEMMNRFSTYWAGKAYALHQLARGKKAIELVKKVSPETSSLMDMATEVDRGTGNKETFARQFGYELNDKVNFRVGRENLPQLLQKTGLRMLSPYKSFLLNQLKYTGETLRPKGVFTDPKKAVRFVGATIALGGLRANPVIWGTFLAASYLYKELFGEDLAYELQRRRLGKANILLRGVAGELGADISGSVAVMLPQRWEDVLGRFGQIGLNLGRLVLGEKDIRTERKLIRLVEPSQVQRVLDAIDIIRHGEYRTPITKTPVAVERPWVAAVQRTLGILPKDIARTFDEEKVIKEKEAKFKSMSGDLTERWASAIQENNQKAMDNVINRVITEMNNALDEYGRAVKSGNENAIIEAQTDVAFWVYWMEGKQKFRNALKRKVVPRQILEKLQTPTYMRPEAIQ